MNEDSIPVRAMGAAHVVKEQANGDTCNVYSITYEFDNGVIMNYRGDHLKNRTGFSTECVALCQSGYLQSGYDGRTRILGQRAGWRGGDVEGLYGHGATRNIATFHENITSGFCDNPTVAPSVNSTLATILGREAGRRTTQLTLSELIQENRALEVDTTGLKV